MVSEFRTQLSDMDVHGALVPDPVCAPGQIQQLPAGQGQAAMFDQCEEEVIFAASQFHRLSADAGFMRHLVYYEIADLVSSRTVRLVCRRPSKDGFDSGDEFARAEGLRDVVVCTELQPHHPVDLVISSGHEDHRHL